MQHRSRLALVAGTASLSIALLAGCSSPAPTSESSPEPAPQTQTVAEACSAIEEPLLKISEDITEANTLALDDPAVLVPAFEQAANEMLTVSGEIGNTEVADVLDAAIAALVTVTEQYSLVLEDPAQAESDEFSGAFEELLAAFTAIDTTCTA